MHYVEVFKTTEEGQELFFKVSYDGSISYEGVPPDLITTWEKYGIPVSIVPRRLVKPEDGLEFLKAIARDFNGSMTRSNNVMEE